MVTVTEAEVSNYRNERVDEKNSLFRDARLPEGRTRGLVPEFCYLKEIRSGGFVSCVRGGERLRR